MQDLKKRLPKALKLYEQAMKDRAAIENIKSTITELAAQEEVGTKKELEGKGGTPDAFAGEVTV